MEEKDLAEDENKIVLKPKKERSEAQVKAFEKAREIRLENSKLKKEKIAQVKEEVKNRNKVPTPLPVIEPKIEKELVKKKIIKQADPESSDEEVVIVKKKKKKIVYQVESESEEEQPIPKEKTFQNHDSRFLAKPTIRFC